MSSHEYSISEVIAGFTLWARSVGGINEILNGNAVVSPAELQRQISAAQTSNKQPWPRRSRVISAGVLTVPRLERITVVDVSNDGGVAYDDIDTINPDPGQSFNNGDIIVLVQESTGQRFGVTVAGNIRPNGGLFIAEGGGHQIWLIYSAIGGGWKELARYPADIYPALNAGDFIIDSGTIRPGENKNLLRVEGEYSGEVLATAIATVTTIAVNTFVEFWIDKNDGSGAVMIGSHTSLSTIPAFETPLWRDAINLGTGTHGFTATASGGDVIVSAPAGSGATPNNIWTFYITVSDSSNIVPVFAIPTPKFGATYNPSQTDGVNGTAASDTLDTIAGAGDGDLIYLQNPMTGLKTLLAGTIFASTFYIGAGQIVRCIYDSDAAKYKQVTLATRVKVTLTPNDMKELAGTYNGIACTAYGSAHSWSHNRASFTYQAANDENAVFDAIPIPEGTVQGTPITINLSVSATGGAAANADFHLGYLFVKDGDVSNTGELYTGSPFGIGMSATTQVRSTGTITITPPAGYGIPGQDLQLNLFRVGSTDAYAGNVEFVKMEVLFYVNL